MELWIRSQNKKSLLKINELIVNKNQDGNRWFVINYFGDSETYLGTYNTEERALEILDEIHTTLMFDITTRKLEMSGNAEYNIGTNIIIYTMPKE